MNFKLLIFTFFTIVAVSCTSTKKYNKKLSVKHSNKALIKDVEIVKNALEKAHPGVYWYIAKEKLDFKFDSLKRTLKDSLNALEFYRKLAPIVAEVKCGHTRIYYAGLKLNKSQKDSVKKVGLAPLNQFNYKIVDDKLYLLSVKAKYLDSLKKGSEIISIDSIPSAKIIKSLKSFIGSDGYNTTFHPEVLNKSFANYYYLLNSKKDSSLFVFKDSSGIKSVYVSKEKKLKSVKNKIIKKEEEAKKRKLARDKKRVESKNRYKGLDANKQPLLDFKIDTVLNKTATLTVKSFAFDYNNFHRFFRESFKAIKENEIENLIVDLRNNGGGNLVSCNLLFRYLYNQPHHFTGRATMSTRYFKEAKYADHPLINNLRGIFPLLFVRKDKEGYYSPLSTDKAKKPKKYHFDKKLYVLINGYSFSATSLLSANLQEIRRGIFIGEETGGGYNQCTAGNIPFLTLPNSGLKLRLPLKVIQIENKRELAGRGVFPEIEVKNTIADDVKHQDKVLEKAKEEILKKNILSTK